MQRQECDLCREIDELKSSPKIRLFRYIVIITVTLALLLALIFLASPAQAYPWVAIIEPGSDLVSGTVQIKVKCEDSAGIEGIEVIAGKSFSDAIWFPEPYPTSYTFVTSWDTTQEPNGSTHIVAECYNSVGESEMNQRLVTINNLKGPSISWQKPAEGEQFFSTVSSTQVQASVSKGEGSAINRVRLWCDSTLLHTWTYSPAVNSTTCTQNLNLTSLSLGKHTLKITAENTDGGSTTSTRTIYRIQEGAVLYLAEGSTAWGYSCYISIENPNTSSVTVKITYQTSSGPVAGPQIVMPAKSQATVNPAETVGNTDFSTKIECAEGKVIAADRTMYWNFSGEEAHSAVAVTAPSKTWYLPEGSSKWGFECFLLIQNPNSTPAHCVLTYMTQDQGAKDISVDVPASSRRTYNMKDHIGEADSSIKVTSDIPVIAERAMYRNNRREGHDSTGTIAPSLDYYLAEGAVGWDVGFETWVLVQNPNNEENTVSLTFMTQNGEVKGPTFKMSPNSRQSIPLHRLLPQNTDVSTHVHGTKPIIAERAMYWRAQGQEICHDSIGMDSAHTTFYLPDGETSNGRETWTLVQNPNSTSITVEISYLTPNGQGNVVKTETIPANSRRTFNMATHSGIQGRAAILVTSKTSGKKIMVERAMYWNSRGTGTDTIGGYSD